MTPDLGERLSRIGETGLGLVLALMPVGLWVAWTPLVWGVVMAAGLVAAALRIALDHRRTGKDASASPGEAAPALPDAFIATIHQIFPLTYHHSREGPRRFRDAMEKLRDGEGPKVTCASPERSARRRTAWSARGP